ncbi:DM9 repeat-containing protein [Rheinheimera oceanensis]|uniref:DM9 repeat-containing protein n=1 Tax=Rheinheimera oceanensis TaxID=2817449 RepID=UPI001BFDD082|nr:DM9 repeat-containing protein [Rheinheimera oceanensis]
MRSIFSKMLFLISILLPFQSSAAWFGEYDTDFDFNFLNPYLYVHFGGMESGRQMDMFYCTDMSERRVPGKLIEGVCYVEWKGKEHANRSFYVLKGNNYEAVRLTAANKNFILQNGVTPGTIDEGNYVYHCSILINDNLNRTLGKYIPSRDGCYYSWHGRGHFKHMNDNSATLHVLVKRYIP